jgi:predicted small secreted protein
MKRPDRGTPHWIERASSARREVGEMKRILAMLILSSVLGALAACNTIAGAGKDIERGGQVIRDTAKDVQRRM